MSEVMETLARHFEAVRAEAKTMLDSDFRNKNGEYYLPSSGEVYTQHKGKGCLLPKGVIHIIDTLIKEHGISSAEVVFEPKDNAVSSLYRYGEVGFIFSICEGFVENVDVRLPLHNWGRLVTFRPFVADVSSGPNGNSTFAGKLPCLAYHDGSHYFEELEVGWEDDSFDVSVSRISDDGYVKSNNPAVLEKMVDHYKSLGGVDKKASWMPDLGVHLFESNSSIKAMAVLVGSQAVFCQDFGNYREFHQPMRDIGYMATFRSTLSVSKLKRMVGSGNYMTSKFVIEDEVVGDGGESYRPISCFVSDGV